MKFTLNYYQTLLLFLWGGAFLYLFLMIYLPLKQLRPQPVMEVALPEEYQKLMEVLRASAKSEAKMDSVDLSAIMKKTNPFFQRRLPEPNVNGTTILVKEQVNFKLKSIMAMENWKVCYFNDRPYTIGQMVGEYKITEIGDYYVKLKGPKGVVKVELGAVFSY